MSPLHNIIFQNSAFKMSDSNKTFVGYDVQGGYLQKWRNGITQYYELEKISMNEAGKIQKVFADCRLLFSANTIHYLVVYVTNSYNSEFRSIFLEVVKKHNNIKKVWIIGPEAIFCCAAIAEMKKNEELFTNDIWCIIASQTSVCCNMFELVKDKTNKLWRLRCSKVLKRTSAANESVSIKELESLKNEIICSGHPYIYAHGINTSILEYVFPNGKQIDNKHISVDMFARYAVLLGMGKFDFGYSHFKCSSCSGRPLKIEL
uniref:Uncharacterized protein n=1 Tax=Panagrolaimus sp. PS1159 TaxID=55785 RepID=A0AC35GT77_9BILA